MGLSSAVVGGVTSSPIDPNGNNNGTGKRSRVFIDPLTEIPKLERWFSDDTHPSSYIIEKYTEELNRAPYRQRFPRLEPKNLQLWFKNHRAKMKRQREACSAAAAAAAAVVAAAATAATAASPNGERNRNNGNNNGNANGLAIGRQLALPYVNDAISDKHDHPQHQSFGGRGAGNGGSNDGAGADGDSRYDDIDDENSVDSDCSKYGDKRTSDDDEEEEQSDKQYRQVIASGFGCGGGGGGSSSNDLLSVNGNSSCKEMRRDCGSGGGSSYAAGLNSRNGGGSVTGALDALVMRLQSGPFAAHSVSKPEVH